MSVFYPLWSYGTKEEKALPYDSSIWLFHMTLPYDSSMLLRQTSGHQDMLVSLSFRFETLSIKTRDPKCTTNVQLFVWIKIWFRKVGLPRDTLIYDMQNDTKCERTGGKILADNNSTPPPPGHPHRTVHLITHPLPPTDSHSLPSVLFSCFYGASSTLE